MDASLIDSLSKGICSLICLENLKLQFYFSAPPSIICQPIVSNSWQMALLQLLQSFQSWMVFLVSHLLGQLGEHLKD